MSDKFYPMNLKTLIQWILNEEKQETIFGIHKDLFFTPSPNDPFQMKRFDQALETPLGVAAGPHTQLSQNIITAWLLGARFIELKTVQTLDELEVSKPCIDMEDEGYNCEWSQELLLEQSFHQYLDAWIALHILRHKQGLVHTAQPQKDPGFIFNMSIGYNLEGILKDNVQLFLERMKNAGEHLTKKLEMAAELYPPVKDLEISSCLSDNITLSTMHGCPPEEIESIARYLIEKRKYHTTIKLNPTLLGPETLRGILNGRLGYETDVPDEAFGHDLKYDDAVRIIGSLTKSAEDAGVHFGLKLTNTLECINHREVFRSQEKMMYMSGRALHPLSINVAAKLQDSFEGKLDISFSAGADCFNISDILASGLKPVTLCSDLLKPGGYARIPQYLENLSAAMEKAGAKSLEEFGANHRDHLREYAGRCVEDGRYGKSEFPGSSIKTNRRLEFFDCIEAPCASTCPTNQDVPEYMFHTAGGNAALAFETILRKNPFPSVTGKVCDHWCMDKCTRQNMDNSLHIRAIKAFAADRGKDAGEKLERGAPIGLKAAIIGAGPSGLSCAYFLALAGAEVEVFEAKSFVGGMVSDAIPGFRLSDEDIRKDVARIEALGVRIHFNRPVDKDFFGKLRNNFDFVYIAVGAQLGTPMKIEGEDLPAVTPALSFLSRIRRGEKVAIGPKVAVIGGGNTAMDAARTVRRLVAKGGGTVTILYRRTRKQMPADPHEIEAALKEGVVLEELVTPVGIEEGKQGLDVSCWRMELGEKDDSGRRRPVKIEGSDFVQSFDTLISAIGQRAVLDFMDDMEWKPVKENGETALDHVYMGGDALRGPANIITAIGDGKQAAVNMLRGAGKRDDLKDFIKDISGHLEPGGHQDLTLALRQKKAATREYGTLSQPEPGLDFKPVSASISAEEAVKEAGRCLQCGDMCSVCVSVCPNRANVFYRVSPSRFPVYAAMNRGGKADITEIGAYNLSQGIQVYNIADSCNECGNCETFCPSAGAPYKDKPKVCLSEESFAAEPRGFLFGKTFNGADCLTFKGNGKLETLSVQGNVYIYITEEVEATVDRETLRVTGVNFQPGVKRAILMNVVPMGILFAYGRTPVG